MSEKEPPGPISPEEDRMIGETPAVLSNKFYVTNHRYGTKITFAEGYLVNEEAKFQSRCAVYLSPHDVRDLYQLLKGVVDGMSTLSMDNAKRLTDG